VAGNRIEPPLDLGDDSEGAFGSDDEIEEISALQVSIESIARRILPGSGESAPDQRLGLANGRRRVSGKAGLRCGGEIDRLSTPQTDRLSFGGEQSERLDPAAYAAVAERSGAGSVGRNHSSKRSPPPARGIGRKPEPHPTGLIVERAQDHCGAGYRLPVHPIDLESLISEAGEVHDHALAYITTCHGAPRASRNQRNPVLGGPADQAPEISQVGGEADGSGKDAIDPCGFGVGCTSPLIRSVDTSHLGSRQHRPKVTIFRPWLSILALN
jgi:hypothetical protein